MSNSLLRAVNQYTLAHADAQGMATTPVPGLVFLRRVGTSELEHALVRPLLCLVLQGSKHVSIGLQEQRFAAGDSMLVTSSMPTVSRIATASTAKPYISIALDLDTAIISELLVINGDHNITAAERAQADTALHDAMHRLVKALDQPSTLAVLQGSLLREIHYWLLLGSQAEEVRRLGLPDSHVRRIARAVAMLRSNYRKTLPIAHLAAATDMGRSAFHQHFRAVTSLSPLQFQKHLRLIEARRLIQEQGKSASRAAFEVGYESTSQFNREYARLFGLPPLKDKRERQ